MEVFKSKVDTWLYLLLLFTSVLPALGVSGFILYIDASTIHIFIATSTLLVGVGVPFWLFTATDYRVQDAYLLVRSGPFRWNIEISSIKRVEQTNSLLSGPALSLDRLLITYQTDKEIIISPKEKELFAAKIGFPYS